MARKEIIIDIQDREQLLTFKIKEMPATRLEAWIIRALLLLAGAGAPTPQEADLKAAGAFLAQEGLSALSGIDYDKARPLLDELLGCCARVVEKVEERCTPASVDNYILDVNTLFTLRTEAVKLNLGFLAPEAARRSGSPATASISGQ
jgi:hypothetical protein